MLDELQVVDLTGCANEELVAIAGRTEQAIARLTFAGDRQLVECSDRHLSAEMGYRSEPSFHDQYLRIVNPQPPAGTDGGGTPASPTGEPLAPKHPALAEAFAAGEAGTSHIRTVLDILDEIPDAVAHDVQVAAERTMARHARALRRSWPIWGQRPDPRSGWGTHRRCRSATQTGGVDQPATRRWHRETQRTTLTVVGVAVVDDPGERGRHRA